MSRRTWLLGLGLAAAVAVAALLVLGRSVQPNLAGGGNVALLTGSPWTTKVGCYTNWIVGQLVDDPDSGTALGQLPVMWPPGYTARRFGVVTSVYNPAGDLVASTGQTYKVQGGYVDSLTWEPASPPPGLPASGAFLACGFVTPPDATSP